MKCERVIAWLLGSASPEQPPSELMEHLSECFRCRQKWQRLMRLESALAAGRPGASMQTLEDLLQRQGFASAEMPTLQCGVGVAADSIPARAIPCQGRRTIRALWCLVPTIAVAVLTAALVAWSVSVGWWQRDTTVAQGTSDRINISAASSLPTVSASSERHTVSATKPHTIDSDVPPAFKVEPRPIDTAVILAQARQDAHIVWKLLDNAVVLVRKGTAAERTASVGAVTCLLGEEALRLAKDEWSKDVGHFVEWFGFSQGVLVRLVSRLHDPQRVHVARQWQERLSALATSARAQASTSPTAISAELQQLVVYAERGAADLKQFLSRNSGSGEPKESGIAATCERCSAQLLSRLSGAEEKLLDEKGLLDKGANEMDWLCVIYAAEVGCETEADENPTAYLLLSSVRVELINLIINRALSLAEETDSLIRTKLALDLTEGVLRALGVISGVGSSRVCKRMAGYFNALVLATVEANWPEYDESTDAGSPTRQSMWYQCQQRMADILAVLELGEEEMATPVRWAWRDVMNEVESGMEALRLAYERGMPQPPVKPEKPLMDSHAKPLSPQGSPPKTTKPVNKPRSEAPAKPEYIKPHKPPFKPGKPFPERFKDLKDFWQGKKR